MNDEIPLWRYGLAPLPEGHEALPREEDLITEDDTPVDNIFSEKQQRLLTEPLHSSWEGPGSGRTFIALANVGLFFAENQPPVVPDMMLAVDVELPEDLWPKKNRSYFMWKYGKAPEVVVEVVSNKEGGEQGRKRTLYASIGVAYYIIFDPLRQIQDKALSINVLEGRDYRELGEPFLPTVRLGLTLW